MKLFKKNEKDYVFETPLPQKQNSIGLYKLMFAAS